MARFRHTVLLVAVPQRWFEDCVRLGHEVLGEHLGRHLDEPTKAMFRLVDGTALQPGARYEAVDGPLDLELLAWGRHTDTAARLHTADDSSELEATVRFSTPDAVRAVAADVDVRIKAGRWAKSLGTARLEVRADLARWWSGATPSLSAKLGHRLFRASFDVSRVPAAGGKWAVTVTCRVHGRTALRPFTALMLLGTRSRIRAEFAEGLDQFAADWNAQLPELLRKDRDELRELIRAEVSEASRAEAPEASEASDNH
ncbi:hypothetical protein ACRAKI_10220 [Saccharothrix isguenensis]